MLLLEEGSIGITTSGVNLPSVESQGMPHCNLACTREVLSNQTTVEGRGGIIVGVAGVPGAFVEIG
jgi:hypothetical protein